MTTAQPYTLQGADDFVRLDNLCHQLLKEFVVWLQEGDGAAVSPERAGALTHAADRFLRDFVVEFKETGPADEDPGLVRQYLGNWYVIHTLEPNHTEIVLILEALQHLYRFLGSKKIVSPAAVRAFHQAISDPQYFHDRLEGFWALTSEQIPAWREVDDYRHPRCTG